MDKNHALETVWSDFKSKCDYYYARILGRPLAPPEHVYFSLTNRCNFRCKMCGIPSEPAREEDELTTRECYRVIDQVAELGVGHLVFSGGEPMLRKDIFDLVGYAVGKKIRMVDMISNGALIDEAGAKTLVGLGLNHITISIDGMQDSNDFIRGPGAFQKAVRAMDWINRFKHHGSPTVGINFTIMDQNIGQMLSMVDLAREKACNIIVLQPMLSDNTDMQERKKSALWVAEQNIPSLKEAIVKVLELKKSLSDINIYVNEKILRMIPAYFEGLPLDRDLKCYEGIVRIVVTCGGDLWTCHGLYGNLKNNSLRDCWFSAKAKKIRQDIKACRRHCLQNCIYLADFSGMEAEAENFRAAAFQTESRPLYQKKWLGLLGRYRALLRKAMFFERWKRIFNEGDPDYFKELNLEDSRILGIIRDQRPHGR